MNHDKAQLICQLANAVDLLRNTPSAAPQVALLLENISELVQPKQQGEAGVAKPEDEVGLQLHAKYILMQGSAALSPAHSLSVAQAKAIAEQLIHKVALDLSTEPEEKRLNEAGYIFIAM